MNQTIEAHSHWVLALATDGTVVASGQCQRVIFTGYFLTPTAMRAQVQTITA
jgi:hypothetical protein